MIQTLFFVLGSVIIIYVSWGYLLKPQHHGFFRFFAFETDLALIALQLMHWFENPLAAYQIASWVLLILAILPVVMGYATLRRAGKPQGSFENTTRLVRSGIYRYIRHPMYASLLLLAWGTFFKLPSWTAGGLALGATAFLFATARVEEAEDMLHFGPEYGEYMKETKRFIPFVF